jgi:hypothetical protein
MSSSFRLLLLLVAIAIAAGCRSGKARVQDSQASLCGAVQILRAYEADRHGVLMLDFVVEIFRRGVGEPIVIDPRVICQFVVRGGGEVFAATQSSPSPNVQDVFALPGDRAFAPSWPDLVIGHWEDSLMPRYSYRGTLPLVNSPNKQASLNELAHMKWYARVSVGVYERGYAAPVRLYGEFHGADLLPFISDAPSGGLGVD